MGIKYKDVVPWGRSLDEYVKMFSLSPGDLDSRILDCGGGPASFNAEMAQQEKSVVSVDPIYSLSALEIRVKIDETLDEVIAQTKANSDKFVWVNIASPEELIRVRMTAMSRFLSDFEPGKQQGRYIAAGLPALPFEDNSFDIALSSHFLFLYSERLSLDFHRKAIEEMLRVSGEVRIFPMHDLNTLRSQHIKPLTEELKARGFEVMIGKVDYEFRKGGNQMMRIVRRD